MDLGLALRGEISALKNVMSLRGRDRFAVRVMCDDVSSLDWVWAPARGARPGSSLPEGPGPGRRTRQAPVVYFRVSRLPGDVKFWRKWFIRE